MNNHLHELIEIAKDGGIEFFQDTPYDQVKAVMNDFRSSAHQAVCFFAGSYDEIIHFKAIPELVRLPYPVTWVEFCQEIDQVLAVVGYMCIEDGDGIYAYVYRRVQKIWAYLFCIRIEKHESFTAHDDWVEDAEEKIGIQNLIWGLRAFLSALNCTNIRQVESRPPEKLQASRRKKGKLPLYSTWTLAINMPGKSASENDLGGTHASPRVHLRRGHPRQYAPGKYTWVQPCVVGNKSSGMVSKDYAARYGADA